MNGAVTLAAAWQRHDAKIADDVRSFWLNLRALPAGVTVEQRLGEVCAAAYVGDELAGVSTIKLTHSPLLRCRVGAFRCFVSPAHIRRRIAWRLFKHSRALLENWSKENPHEKVLGMLAILENPNFYRSQFGKRPVWHGTDLRLIGYTTNNQQIRLTWFEHARLE